MNDSGFEPIWPLAVRQLKSGVGIPLLICASVLLVCFLLLTPLTVSDFWTQLTVGDMIRATGRIPATVFFAFGEVANSPFVAYEWLPSLAMSVIYAHAGMEGAIVFRTVLGLLIWGLLVLLSFQINRNFLLSLFVAMVSFWVITCRLPIRPEMFSFVFGLVELNLLQCFLRTKDRRLLFALIPLAVIWANCHGSFPVGVVIAFIFAAGAVLDELLLWRKGAQESGTICRHRLWLPFAVAGLGMAAACLLNPFGWALIAKVLSLTSSDYIRASILEWTPLYSPNFTGSRAFGLFVLYLILVADSLVQRPASHPARLYLFIGFFLILSIDANRHIGWFAIMGCYAMAHTLEGSRRLAERRNRNAVWLAAVLLIGCFTTSQFGNFTGVKPGFRDESPLGAEAIAFIRKSGYKGNAFNSYGYGGKLAYYFYPRIRITIDDRIDAYGEAYYQNFQRFDATNPLLLAEPDEFLSYFEQNKLNLIVVRSLTMKVWRRWKILAALNDAGWGTVYRSAKTSILRRNPNSSAAHVEQM